MPTHDETARLYRKLVDVLGQNETNTLFTLIWESNGRQPTDFRRIYGSEGPANSPSTPA